MNYFIPFLFELLPFALLLACAVIATKLVATGNAGFKWIASGLFVLLIFNVLTLFAVCALNYLYLQEYKSDPNYTLFLSINILVGTVGRCIAYLLIMVGFKKLYSHYRYDLPHSVGDEQAS